MARVALVTGGTRGIGLAISLALKEQGRKVIANYASNDEAAAAFKAEHGIDVAKFNVASFEDTEKGIAKIAEEHGKIEILVNNAGITRDGTLVKMRRDMWDAVIDTNLGSCFNTSKLTFEGMRDAKFGRIVNIGSLNGQAGQYRSGQLRRCQVGYSWLHQGSGFGRRALRHHRECTGAGLC